MVFKIDKLDNYTFLRRHRPPECIAFPLAFVWSVDAHSVRFLTNLEYLQGLCIINRILIIVDQCADARSHLGMEYLPTNYIYHNYTHYKPKQ